MRPDLDPGGERSAYFPLALVAPTDEANLSMINQDAYTEQAHRVAMDEGARHRLSAGYQDGLRAHGVKRELERRPRPQPRLRRVPSGLRRGGACGECRRTEARPRRVRRRVFQAGRAAR